MDRLGRPLPTLTSLSATVIEAADKHGRRKKSGTIPCGAVADLEDLLHKLRDCRMAEDNHFLGDFVLDGIRSAPRGEISIEI